jgi:hypothetical protein
VRLYRPVGPEELKLIEESAFSEFPPRLEGQPIFYPVLTRDYAIQIARDWNVRESGAGYVTEFDVSAEFLADYEIQTVGSRQHREYWIPAEHLAAFNQAIVGTIRVIDEFGGDPR